MAEAVSVEVPLSRQRDAQPLLDAHARRRQQRGDLRHATGSRVERVCRGVAVTHGDDRPVWLRGRGGFRHRPRRPKLGRRHRERGRACGALRPREIRLATSLQDGVGPALRHHHRSRVRGAQLGPAAAAIVAARVGDDEQHTRLVARREERTRRERHALVALDDVDGVRQQRREAVVQQAASGKLHHGELAALASCMPDVARVGRAEARMQVQEQLRQDLGQVAETPHLALRHSALEGREARDVVAPALEVAQHDALLRGRAVDQAIAQAQAQAEVDEDVATLRFVGRVLEAHLAYRRDGDHAVHSRPRVAPQRLAADRDGGERVEVDRGRDHAAPDGRHRHSVIDTPAREVIKVHAGHRRRDLVGAVGQQARTLARDAGAAPRPHCRGERVQRVKLALPQLGEGRHDDGDALEAPRRHRAAEADAHEQAEEGAPILVEPDEGELPPVEPLHQQEAVRRGHVGAVASRREASVLGGHVNDRKAVAQCARGRELHLLLLLGDAAVDRVVAPGGVEGDAVLVVVLDLAVG